MSRSSESAPAHKGEDTGLLEGGAVVLGGTRRQHARAETARLRDQLRVGIGDAERLRREYRRAGVMGIEVAMHASGRGGRERRAQEIEHRAIESLRGFDVR